MSKLTQRQIDALQVLSDNFDYYGGIRRGMSPSAFAAKFWPNKEFARGNGPWGLGPDASGRHGGKMLNRLHSMGLVSFNDFSSYYLAYINDAGISALADCREEVSK